MNRGFRHIPAARVADENITAAPVIETSRVGTVRPAVMDRPLRRGSFENRYSDPHLEQMVQEAADRAREEARAEGYAAGWAQGRHAAVVQGEQELESARQNLAVQQADTVRRMSTLLSGLAQASRTVQQDTGAEWAEVADVLAEGTLRLAAAAMGRELQSVDDAMAQSVRVALRTIADPQGAIVHLHPQDAALLSDPPEGVRIIPDPAVPAGGVVALTAAQRLRIDLPTALAAAEEVLRS